MTPVLLSRDLYWVRVPIGALDCKILFTGLRAGSRDVVAGGGALEAEVLNRVAKAARGEGRV